MSILLPLYIYLFKCICQADEKKQSAVQLHFGDFIFVFEIRKESRNYQHFYIEMYKKPWLNKLVLFYNETTRTQISH